MDFIAIWSHSMFKNSNKGILHRGLLICWTPTIVWCSKEHKMRYKEASNRIKLWTQPLSWTRQQGAILNLWTKASSQYLSSANCNDGRTDGLPGCLGRIVRASAWQFQVEIRTVKILREATSFLTRFYHVTTFPQECNTNISLATFGCSLIELESICHERKKISKIYRLTTDQ